MSDDKFVFQKERTFQIDHVSAEDGQRYQGSFSCKRLSLGDASRMAARKAQLCGGMHHGGPGKGVDVGTDVLNEMIAHCEVAIINSPPWWDALNTYDIALLQEVYEEVVAFGNFREWEGEREAVRNGEAAKGGLPANGDSQRAGARHDDGTPKMVDLQV